MPRRDSTLLKLLRRWRTRRACRRHNLQFLELPARRHQRWVLAYRTRKAQRDRYWEARRRQALAARRRRQRLENMGAVERARRERKEQARARRIAARYQGVHGVIIKLNIMLRPESGKANKLMLFAVLFMLAFSTFMSILPALLLGGLITIVVRFMFELPGVMQATQWFASFSCVVLKPLVEGAGGVWGWFQDNIVDPAVDAIKATGIIGESIGLTWLMEKAQTAAEVVHKSLDAAKEVLSFACTLKQYLLDPIEKVYGKELEAAISCANWPSYLGPLSSPENTTPEGRPRYCVDGRRKTETQSQIPTWLIPIYKAAGAQYNVPWQLLAAINWNDTEYGAKELNKKQQQKVWKVNVSSSLDMAIWKNVADNGPNAIIDYADVMRLHLTDDLQKFLDSVKKTPKKARQTLKSAVESATSVGAEWQQPNPLKKERAGWIPFSKAEWQESGIDFGNVPPRWASSPYQGIGEDSPQACPMPVDSEGNAAAGLPASSDAAGSTAQKADLSKIGKWPGDGAGKKAVAQWMADAARRHGIPGHLPVMAALTESGLRNINGGDRDSVGYFQMRTGIFNKNPRYRGYLQDPRLQMLWFLDTALELKHKRGGKVPPDSDPAAQGLFIADIERPAEQYRGRYATHYDEAKKLIRNGLVSQFSDPQVTMVPDGDVDTCDPVDGIFGLARRLAQKGAQGDTWNAALVGGEGLLNQRDRRKGVMLVGDSLAQDISGKLEKLVRAESRDFFADTQPKRNTAQAYAQVAQLQQKKRLPGILVMHVGAYDPKMTDGQMTSWINQTMRLVGDRCVIWPTTITNKKPRFARSLVAAQGRFDNLLVPRWDQIGKPYLDKDDEMGAHTTDRGDQRRAEMISQAIMQCAGASADGGPEPAGAGVIVRGQASSFGAIYDAAGNLRKVDPSDKNKDGSPLGVACAKNGVNGSPRAHRKPGVAIRPGATYMTGKPYLCGWWWIKAPNGKTAVVQQIDLGPYDTTGVRFDLNSKAAKLFGYGDWSTNFPTKEGTWKGVYLGMQKPASVTGLSDPASVAAGATEATIEGDSLVDENTVRSELRKQLSGWKLDVDAKVSRQVSTGINNIKRMRLKKVLAFALGTNSWDNADSSLRKWVTQAMDTAGPRRCVVLTTVWSGGRAQPKWNRQVQWAQQHYGPARVQVADWAAQVRAGKVRLADGTHPADSRSWRVRAKVLADGIKACAGQVGAASGQQDASKLTLKELFDPKPPKNFKKRNIPPLQELKKHNKDLPKRPWRHDPVPPLKEPFPSFDTGLKGERSKGRNCDDNIATDRQMGVFYAAADTFSIPWQIMAAYAQTFSNYGCSGAGHPFSQVGNGFETDALRDGEYDRSDPVDATFSNARSLYALGGDHDPVAAIRKLTQDSRLRIQIAYHARELGYNSTGIVKLLDDGIGQAVAERDHLINKTLCPDQESYVECIASLYRKLMGVEDNSASPGGWLTGGCNPPPVPDTNLKPYSLDSKARTAEGGAYVKVKDVKGVATTVGKTVGGIHTTWARKDALLGELAALRTFGSCYPQFKKQWRDVRMNDWGAGKVKSSWATSFDHATHENGADNDQTTNGVNDMTAAFGKPWNRKQTTALARMMLRAGAYKLIFADPKVRADVTKARKDYAKEHPEVIRKLGAHYTDAPTYDTNDGVHRNHFHVHWYVFEGANPVPAKVKVWVTDKSRSGQAGDDSSAPSGPLQGSGEVLVVGDSLEIFTSPELKKALPNVKFTFNFKGGNNSNQIYQRFKTSFRPKHSVVLFDAGTNDNPLYARQILKPNLEKVARDIGNRCLVVPTVHSLFYAGVGPERKNAVIRAFARSHPGTQVPDWKAMRDAHPEYLFDSLHPNARGAKKRAQLLAQGISACLGSMNGSGNHAGGGHRGKDGSCTVVRPNLPGRGGNPLDVSGPFRQTVEHGKACNPPRTERPRPRPKPRPRAHFNVLSKHPPYVLGGGLVANWCYSLYRQGSMSDPECGTRNLLGKALTVVGKLGCYQRETSNYCYQQANALLRAQARGRQYRAVQALQTVFGADSSAGGPFTHQVVPEVLLETREKG